MKKDTEITKVVFRKFKPSRCKDPYSPTYSKGGEIIALFPEQKEGHGMIGSYMHVGQHSAASTLLVRDTVLATPDECAALQKELESIGYNLKIQKRINR